MSRSCGRSWDYGSYLRSKCTQMLPWWEGHSQFQNMKDQKLNQKKADTEVNIGMERCSLREVKEGGALEFFHLLPEWLPAVSTQLTAN